MEEVDVDELDKVRALDQGVMDQGVSDTNEIFDHLNEEVLLRNHLRWRRRLCYTTAVAMVVSAAREPWVFLWPQLLGIHSVTM